MKHFYRFCLVSYLLILTTQIWAQSTSNNYIISRSYKQAGLNEDFSATEFAANSSQAASQVMYYDGLGKPIQVVKAYESGSKGDVVILTEYDNLFRPVRTFLPAPYASATNRGWIQANGDVKSKDRGYYTDGSKISAPIGGSAPDENLSAQTSYESSPLNRVTSQQAPSSTTQVSQVYGVNTDNQVQYYKTTDTVLTAIVQQDFYPAGSLTWTQITDENGSVVTEFKDREGRTVMKGVKAADDSNLDTYYVYDEKGQLRAVLQPKYNTFGEGDLNTNAFLYSYDNQGRLTAKKVPGANAVHMTYKDNTELLETSTDGVGNVFYYKYDNLNRQIEMGVTPVGKPKIDLQYTYYDDYSFGAFKGFNNELNLDGTQFASNPNQQRLGLQTGSKVRLLMPDGNYGDWLQTVIYYDDKYRVVQTIRQLYGLGGAAYERTSYKLAFDGKPEQEWTTQVTNSISYRLVKSYTYDHANRLTKTDHVLYENDVQKKAYTHLENIYNEVGQLAGKSLHGGRQILTYKYTPRGWLGDHQTSNGQTFGITLTYQDNGNITNQFWKTKSYSGGMNLSYDKANRLTGATGTNGFTGNDESSIQYDANGNIIKLNRVYTGTVIDQLTYNYHGNQLHRVDDQSTNESLDVKGFINTANADNEMAYDGNGNLTRDDNRSITNISYNVLNLPRSVTRNGRTVLYTYDGSGTKHKSEAPNNVNTYYAGAFEYLADNTLLRIGLEEGQLVKDGDSYVVHYYLRDHLGNVRAVMDENGNIVQETEYYAFGLSIQGNGSDKNKYLYNGKEKQPETEWLDYGARMYEPGIGRWMKIDPLAEKMLSWSPYTFCFDNPTKYFDETGQIPYPITIRSFAPYGQFGFVFHGDGRGYSTNTNETARLHQRIDFDTDKTSMLVNAWSSPTFIRKDMNGAKRATPEVEFNKDLSITERGDSQVFEFGVSAKAANPKTPFGTPDINVFSDFSVTDNKKDGTLSVKGKLTGDNFPSTEAFITDPKGKSLFLRVGQINANVDKDFGPATELYGENRSRPITNFNITITRDRSGNFTGVRVGGQSYSIDDWNKKYSNMSPQKQN